MSWNDEEDAFGSTREEQNDDRINQFACVGDNGKILENLALVSALSYLNSYVNFHN